VKFLGEDAVEPNSKMTCAQLLNSHISPYIAKRQVAGVGRETVHRLRTVGLSEEGVSQNTVVNVRTYLSAMMQMAWDHGDPDDNPVAEARLAFGGSAVFCRAMPALMTAGRSYGARGVHS
jgi:hypothetical protein